MDLSLPGFSVHGILQARILEWVAIFFSRESSQPRNRTWVSCIAGALYQVSYKRESLNFKISSFVQAGEKKKKVFSKEKSGTSVPSQEIIQAPTCHWLNSLYVQKGETQATVKKELGIFLIGKTVYSWWASDEQRLDFTWNWGDARAGHAVTEQNVEGMRPDLEKAFMD